VTNCAFTFLSFMLLFINSNKKHTWF
jgi:hypothetical protein